MKPAYTNDIVHALQQHKVQTEQQKNVPQIWYNKAELCRHFGITYNTLKRWERHCNFPLQELQSFCNGRYDIRKVERFLHKLRMARL